MTQNLKISKGEVVVLTEGEYSDYGICGYFVAIKDFDMAEQAQLFVKESKLSVSDFQAFLIGKELTIPVAHREIHLGNYSKFDDEFNAPRNY